MKEDLLQEHLLRENLLEEVLLKGNLIKDALLEEDLPARPVQSVGPNLFFVNKILCLCATS